MVIIVLGDDVVKELVYWKKVLEKLDDICTRENRLRYQVVLKVMC